MSKFIALISGYDELPSDALNNDFSTLKQQILLFDQIGILKLNNFHEAINRFLEESKAELSINFSDKLKSMVSDLEYLRQMDIIFEPLIQEAIPSPEQLPNKLPLETIKEVVSLFNIIAEANQKSNSVKTINPNKLVELNRKQIFAILRIMSIFMEVTNKATVVTTMPYTSYNINLPNSIKSDITQIVIKKLPLPSNDTPWEQIIDYRNDPENQERLRDLRKWIRKTSSESISLNEIESEIEWLMSEFQRHMKIHKMKANTETLEIITKTPFETIENILKLKLSKLPEPLFALKKRQIKLLEAELNSPGREMSYLIKAKDTFQSPK